MKQNKILKTVLLIFALVLLTSCSSYDKATDLLNPVDNPMEYQNEFYPINIGEVKIYNQYDIVDGKLAFTNRYEREVTDYRESDVRIGSREFNVPVFRIKMLEYENDSLISKYEEYLIKTNEGIAFTTYLSFKKNIIIFELVPSSPKFAPFRQDICLGKVFYNVRTVPFLADEEYMVIENEMAASVSKTYSKKCFYAKNKGLVAIMTYADGELANAVILVEEVSNDYMLD